MDKACNVCGEEKPHKSWKSTTCNECLAKGLKWCSECKQVRPITDFHKNGHTIRSFCKKCECSRSIQSKTDNGYYKRSDVIERRNKASRKCKVNRYHTDESYRIAEIVRCHNRRQSVGALSSQEWHAACKAFNFKCAYCGSSQSLTMDHVIAVSCGGSTDVSNIIPACQHCNSSKQNSDIVEWYTTQPFYKKERLESIMKYLESKKGR